MPATVFSEGGWREIMRRHEVEDNGLQRAIAAYNRIEEEEFDDRLAGVAEVIRLVAALRRDREVVSNSAVVRYLTQLAAAAETEKRDIAREQAEAARAQAQQAKIQAQAERARARREEEEEDHEEDGEEDEEDDGAGYRERILQILNKLKGSRDLVFQALICDAKPRFALMLARRIGAPHRQQLMELTGSRKFLRIANCQFQDGKFVIDLDRPPSGLARKLQESIKFFTGRRFTFVVGGQNSEDEEEGSDSGSSEANEEAPESAGSNSGASRASAATPVSEARNAQAEEVEEEEEVIAAPRLGRASLSQAPQVWRETRSFIESTVDRLKTAIRREFAEDGDELLNEIESKLEKLDGIVGSLDQSLADSLERANGAATAAARQTELRNAKAILANYIRYVKSEPLIAQIDENPFGVRANLRRTLTERLTHMAQSIG